MGLDQWSYAISRRHVGQRQVDVKLPEPKVLSPAKRKNLGKGLVLMELGGLPVRERLRKVLASEWRNHWHLAEWMADMYYEKGGKRWPHQGCSISFLRLGEEDFNRLEQV